MRDEPVQHPPAAADLVVIGAGIIGLALAFRAGEKGLRVAVLDSGRVAGGATDVAAGMLTLAHEIEDCEPSLVAFARTSLARYPSFVAAVEAQSGLSCDFRTEGSLFVALDRDDQRLLERLADIHRSEGVASRNLNAAELRAREPDISPRALSALLAPDDRQVDPRRLALALAAAIRGQGGAVIEQLGDIRVTTGQGRVTGVATARGAIDAARVVIAAGCLTNDLLPDGVAKLPLRPVKGQTVRLKGRPILAHTIRTPRVYLAPRQDGEIVIGATMEELGFDDRATVWAVQDMLAEARRTAPAVDELAITSLPVGFRPALRDHLPALGRYGADGLFVATGHYRHGVLLAPVTADAMTALVLGEKYDDGISAFAADRFAAGGAGDRDHAERRADQGRSRAVG